MMFNSAETVDFFLRLKVFEAKNSTTFNALLQSMIQEPFFSFFFSSSCNLSLKTEPPSMFNCNTLVESSLFWRKKKQVGRNSSLYYGKV